MLMFPSMQLQQTHGNKPDQRCWVAPAHHCNKRRQHGDIANSPYPLCEPAFDDVHGLLAAGGRHGFQHHYWPSLTVHGNKPAISCKLAHVLVPSVGGCPCGTLPVASSVLFACQHHA